MTRKQRSVGIVIMRNVKDEDNEEEEREKYMERMLWNKKDIDDEKEINRFLQFCCTHMSLMLV